MNCADCANWVTARITRYSDGSEVKTYEAPSGKGSCSALGIECPPDFGCNRFEAGSDPVRISERDGAPWQHWVMGPCPDCTGNGNAGDGACYRCAGTSKVRYYEDGYIGEERTRLHPREREAAVKPKCPSCQRDVETAWVACPACGQKLDAPADVEKVSDPLFAG